MSSRLTNASPRIGTQIVSVDRPISLVVDSGPVIGAIDEDDEHHREVSRGFQLLADARAQILIPVPIVFEVYKRLAYDVGPSLAARGLDYMTTSLTLLYIGTDELDALKTVIAAMPW